MITKLFTSNIDFDKFYFKGVKGLYIGALATATAVYEAPIGEADNPDFSVKEMLKSGLIVRITLYTQVGQRRRQLKVLCNKNKLDTVSSLVNSTIQTPSGSAVVKSIGIATRVISRD